jgi:hypothetical protein
LANVKIQAFRGGPIFKERKSSGPDGRFAFPVPEGVPFDVVFYLDEETVPQMQALAGKPGISHEFHVGLLTFKQYNDFERLGLMSPLEPKLQAIYASARGDEELTRITKRMLSRIEKK